MTEEQQLMDKVSPAFATGDEEWTVFKKYPDISTSLALKHVRDLVSDFADHGVPADVAPHLAPGFAQSFAGVLNWLMRDED